MSNGSMKVISQDNITQNIIDPTTGEITHTQTVSKIHAVTKPMDEENFVKVYYNTFLASIGENQSKLTPFLISVAKRMSYSTEGQQIILIKRVKEEIAKEIGVSLSRVNHMILESKNLGLLISVGRGVYAVSPLILGKGTWDEVRALQITYNKKLQELSIDAPRPSYLQGNMECVPEDMTMQEIVNQCQRQGESNNGQETSSN